MKLYFIFYHDILTFRHYN